MWHRIQEFSNEIKITAGVSELLRVYFSGRTDLYVHERGSHFEHLLYERKNKDIINSSLFILSLCMAR
jgi:hypothetical protein